MLDKFCSTVKNSGYDAGRGGGNFSVFFLFATVTIIAPYSACCAMTSWSIVVQSKLGAANGMTT